MKSFDEMDYHPTSEKLVEIICARVQNNSPHFFRVHTAFYFAMVASMMRCQIKTVGGNPLPVNMYSINLAPSGFGKGHSTNMLEDEVLKGFFTRFVDETFPLLAQMNLPKLANERAIRKSEDPDDELAKVHKEFEAQGSLEISFSSATTSAIKQFRHKLLMADAGSLNLQVDEIGSNLTGETEAFNALLELYDVGKIKNSLRKSGPDNKRAEAIEGRTPTNMMLFGTPTKLLNGSKVEEEFYSMLDTGYARRCFFGYAKSHNRPKNQTAQEVLQNRVNKSSNTFLKDLSLRLGQLSDQTNSNRELTVSEKVTLLFIEYQLMCEDIADKLPEHEDLRKAEISHRHFKALKLAGAYAFIDGSPEVTEDHAYYAIKLAEASGQAFTELLTRDRPYVKLAKYLADVGRNVTQADLVEDLPFYPKATNQQRDMLQLAIAYGYQNNIIIKKAFVDGIEFLRGESLKATDLSQLTVSYSHDIAKGYKSESAPWDQLHILTQNAGLHWVNHHLIDGHRQEDNCIPGFNFVVLDVDHGVNLSTAKMLLKDYKAMFYTTKRHTNSENRFRIILPTNFQLELDAKDYKEFMNNLYEWLPFDVDTATGQRARKWLSHNGKYEYQDGELLDVLPFIPKTSKNERRKELLNDQQSMDNLERWVINNSGDGNRNNQLLRFAMILLDAGYDFEAIRQRVVNLNDKMADKLEESEIMSTIMVTIGKKLTSK